MQYQENPTDLASIYNLPVAMAPQGMALMNRNQDADQLTAADNQRQFNYDTANDPLKLKEKSLANQTTEAELPWHQAKASMLSRQNSNEATTNDAKIKDILGQYSSADIGRHAKEAEDMGTRMSQMGEEAFSNPVGARQRVKDELNKMGMGHLYNPSWDSEDDPTSPIQGPGLFAKRLQDTGEALQTSSAKFRQAMALAEAKSQAALGVAGINREGKVDVANITSAQRAQAAQALMATKKSIANIPKSLSDYAAKMSQMADQEIDPIAKATYAHEAQVATTRAEQLASASAATTTAPKVNLNKLLGEGSTWGDPPTPTPPMAGAQGIPKDLPPETKANGDGTFTLPDGRTIRPKAK